MKISPTKEWQVIAKFITCLVKPYIRCKTDIVKAKYSKDQAKLREMGGKGRIVVCLASWPLHHFVNKFHNNGSLTPPLVTPSQFFTAAM